MYLFESFLDSKLNTLASRRVLCTSAASSYNFSSIFCNLNLVFLSVNSDAERLEEPSAGNLRRSTSGFLRAADLLTKEVEVFNCLLL